MESVAEAKKIKYDGQLSLAMGSSRVAKHWKNKKGAEKLPAGKTVKSNFLEQA